MQGGAGKLLPGDPDWLVQAPTPHGKARLRCIASCTPACNVADLRGCSKSVLMLHSLSLKAAGLHMYGW